MSTDDAPFRLDTRQMSSRRLNYFPLAGIETDLRVKSAVYFYSDAASWVRKSDLNVVAPVCYVASDV
jgi:hypothetical protein